MRAYGIYKQPFGTWSDDTSLTLCLVDSLITHYRRILSMDIASESEDNISSSGYVVDSIEAVIWCILTTHSYKEAIFKAINLGNDTDTIAALTGGLAGILYGCNDIPENWVQCMARKKDIYELVSAFAKSLFDTK